MLGNVLKVLARWFKRVRYCQGMNYVAGALLIVGGGVGGLGGEREDRRIESAVAFVMSGLMEGCGMADFWR